MTKALIIQHVAPEGPAAIGTALEDRGIEPVLVRVDRGDRVPARMTKFGALVVMGGPMSARSDDGFPSRRAELDLMRAALDAEVPLLGVCLGAQLLAMAAGGTVRPGHSAEVGWSAIELLPAETDALLAGLPHELDVLHWHGETFDLPRAATLLASSTHYRQQAFRVGAHAWGFQFHLEVDHRTVDSFIDAFPEDAACAPGGAAAIRTDTDSALDRLRPVRDLVLRRFADLVASGERERSAMSRRPGSTEANTWRSTTTITPPERPR